jgi:hypothetical protein
MNVANTNPGGGYGGGDRQQGGYGMYIRPLLIIHS